MNPESKTARAIESVICIMRMRNCAIENIVIESAVMQRNGKHESVAVTTLYCGASRDIWNVCA
jgi:hypothetical protein